MLKVGAIIKKVRNKDIAIRTWLGGVCWVPSAWRKIDITIIILVKLVIPRTKDGKTVKPVISNKICRGNEYSVVLPFVDTFNAGKPEDNGSPIAFVDIPVTSKMTAEKENSLIKDLTFLVISNLFCLK